MVLKICSTIPSGFADTFEMVTTDSFIFSFTFISGSFGRDSAGRLNTEDMVGTTALVFETVGLGKANGLDVGVGAPLSGVGVGTVELGWKT